MQLVPPRRRGEKLNVSEPGFRQPRCQHDPAPENMPLVQAVTEFSPTNVLLNSMENPTIAEPGLVSAVISAVGKTIPAITEFLLSYTDAHADLDRVSRELSSLSTSLSILRARSPAGNDGDGVGECRLSGNLQALVQDCKATVSLVDELLVDSRGPLASLRWMTDGKSKAAELTSRLVSHNSYLQIAVDTANM